MARDLGRGERDRSTRCGRRARRSSSCSTRTATARTRRATTTATRRRSRPRGSAIRSVVAGRSWPRTERAQIDDAVERRLAEAIAGGARRVPAGDARGRLTMEARVRHGAQHGADRDLRDARRRLPPRRGRARPVRRRVQGQPGALDALARPRDARRPSARASIFGIAAGMALRGYRPILEIMFGDFIALGFDQMVNGIAKFRAMFDDQVHRAARRADADGRSPRLRADAQPVAREAPARRARGSPS